MLDDLADAVAAADQMLPPLRRMLGEQRSPGPQRGGRSAPESSEPWNAEPAAVYWDIWYGARQLAQRMRTELHLGDDSLPGPEGLAQVLACGPSVSRRTLGQVTARLWSWVHRAQSLPDAGESEPWQHVPYAPGYAAPACPNCKTFGLRMQVRAGIVRCFFPDCCDLDGNPTRARLLHGWADNPAMVFGDGTVLAFPATGEVVIG